MLGRIGFEVENGTVTVPTWRARDVKREIDVVEEVARFRLDDVPFTLPLRRAMTGRLTREQRLRRLAEDALVGAGFTEAYTPTLVPAEREPDGIALPEPLTEEQAVLRTTLVPSLLEAARRNLDAGNEGIALFELARVFLPAGGRLPEERERLAGIVEGGFSRAKGAVELVYEAIRATPRFERTTGPFLHPGKAARTDAGWLGELHPALLEGSWGAFELDLEPLLASAVDAPQYEDIVTYPAVKQDLAFVVDEDVPAGDVVAAIREAVADVREATVFDVYRGGQIPEGRMWVAVAFWFLAADRRLWDV
jgi:phenylalanyl-tRNA synthetase beta chain